MPEPSLELKPRYQGLRRNADDEKIDDELLGQIGMQVPARLIRVRTSPVKIPKYVYNRLKTPS